MVGNNKGADILNGSINLPDFTTKDLKALEICNNNGVSNIFISFCKSKKAVLEAKSIVKNAFVFLAKLKVNSVLITLQKYVKYQMQY